MKGFQYSTKNEIYAAKKILYEGDGSTKKTFIITMICAVSLLVLLILSIMGTFDEWVCEIDSTAPRHELICMELRRTINCKTVKGPIRAEVLLNINKQVKASAMVSCPWEIAVSELRFCFIMLALISAGLGIYAVRSESKKYAELHFHSSILVGALLAIASYFDYVAISNSKVNNFSLCNLKDEFQVDSTVKGEYMDCSFTPYYATVLSSIACAVLIVDLLLYILVTICRSSQATL
eukprot:TRINITY_DN1531_c0_g1_i14.p1 TRINITY_DN1531_c0_g1~~TRINITY_DN1531_c0_g1_i14.p1  ORF type:complete len:236 (+),score=53.83 TRINITY_DN1531_c0_g1_i14:114-821(+)